ncbi:hypothetical protein [Cryptosporangium sp. NPDC048952]|uniref:hypothetical protein n=1 Tax=Cryptosporangium sp. NPDC048952 TaxID=3363961 RepID=UPI00371D8779
MTATQQARRTGYRRIGDGEHSWVYRRPGSRYCVQQFRPDCAELTPDKVRREYTYLTVVYAPVPGLIPEQRLFVPRSDAHISETLLVKRWVEVDTSKPLGRISAAHLAPGAMRQMVTFLGITRNLLASPQVTLLPDIIDDRFQNLAVDTAGNLRLLDTNRLISTRALRQLPPGARLDIERRWIHARFLRRLMYLESAFLGRGRSELRDDWLYRRSLHVTDIDELFARSIGRGETI